MSYTFYGHTLPEDVEESLRRYVEQGVPTGGFLEACIENNLKEAVARADDLNMWIIPVIVGYLYNHCPAGCWGYKGAFERWLKFKRDEREAQEPRHRFGCVCADCSGAELTADND